MLKFEDIRIIVIDKTALDNAIDASIKEFHNHKVGECFRTRSVKWGIIEDTNILTDDECIFKIGNDGIKLDVYSETKTETSHTFGAFPCFTVTLTISDLLKYSQVETVDLISFMGGRYNYNPRIENNQTKLLYHLKNLT